MFLAVLTGAWAKIKVRKSRWNDNGKDVDYAIRRRRIPASWRSDAEEPLIESRVIIVQNNVDMHSWVAAR